MYKKLSKRVFAGIIAVMLLIGFVGCGKDAANQDSNTQKASNSSQQGNQSGSAEGVKEITYFHLSDWIRPVFEQANKEFEAKTGIKVNVEYGTLDGGHEKYLTMINSNTLPDGGYIFSEWTGEFYERGAINPITPYISPEFKEDLVDSVKKNLVYDGNELIALPFITSIRPYIYRPDVFEKYGVKEPPKNLDEMIEIAKKTFDAPNMYGYGLCAGRNKFTVECWLQLFWPLGGELFNADYTKATFNTEAGVKATKMFVELAKAAPEGYLTTDGSIIENAFSEGKIAQTIYGIWVLPTLKEKVPDAKYEVIPAIPGPDGKKVSLYVIDELVLFTKDEAKAKAVTEWYEFWKGDEKFLGEFYDKFNLPPDLKRQYNWKFAKENEIIKSIIPCIEYGRMLPMIPQWSQIMDAINLELASVCVGKVTPEAAMKKAEDAANEILQQ